MEKSYKNILMARAEIDVCAAINKTLASDINPHDLYKFKGNIPVILAVARNLTFYLLHNSFGLSYSDISRRAGMTKESVMRCVRKVQYLSEFDSVYQNLMKEVCDE